MLPEIADMSVVVWLAVLSHMLRVSLSPIDIPDVESLSSPPLCDNLVKALALQRSREEGVRRLVRPASAPLTPILLPSTSLLLSDNLLPTSPQPLPPPPSSSVISIHPYRTIASNPRSPHPRFELTLLLPHFFPPCCLWWDLKSGSDFL